MSISDWLVQQETAATRILNRAKLRQKWTFIYENTTSAVQLQRIFKQTYNPFKAKHAHWLLQWQAKKALKFEKKGIAWPKVSPSVVWNLIYNGKLEPCKGLRRWAGIICVGHIWFRQQKASKMWRLSKLLINGLNGHALTTNPQANLLSSRGKKNNNVAIHLLRGVVTLKGNKDPREKIVWVLNWILLPELKIPLFVSLWMYNVLSVTCNHSLGGFGSKTNSLKIYRTKTRE